MKVKKLKLFKFVNFLLCFLILFTLFPTQIKAEETKNSDVVRVGWYEDSYHITSEDGGRSGYGYEYEQTLASYTGWHYDYVKDDWTNLIEKLQNGDIDLMSGISYTDERAQTMLFSDIPMGKEKYYLYANLANSNISGSDLTTLNGKRIVLLENSVQATQFIEWEKDHNLQTEHVYLNSVDTAMQMVNNNEVDGIISTETPIWVNYGLSAITSTGESGIYYGISKKRPDLKEKLDAAMLKMENDNPFYADDLYKKYLSSASSPVLTSDEQDWLKQHGDIRIGCLKEDSGFSTLDESTGKLQGIINDYILNASDCLGNDTLNFEIKIYDSQEKILDALKKDEIDMIFHVSQNPYMAEKNNLILSNTVLTVPLAVITAKNTFNENDKNLVAIDKNDLYLKWHISYNYPQWKIKEYDSMNQAEKAVKNGDADCLLVKSGNIEKYIDESSFNSIFLTEAADISFATERKSTTLMAILNKTLQAMQSSILAGAFNMYDTTPKKVTISDFVKDNWIPMSIGSISVFIIILFIILRLLQKARLAETKAKEAQAIAEQANAAKSSFLFNMSHDIRTPMNAILGYNQLMKADLKDPKLLDYQEKIDQSGKLLLSIINNVLDMARIESNNVKLDENFNEVGTLLKEVCDVFEMEAKNKGITLTYKTNVIHKYILCDQTNMKEVLLNLISNAVKYTPSGGTVTIRTTELPSEKEGYAKIQTEVIDTGIGISEEYLPHLFDSFSRENNTTIGKVSGTGLGMAIVKKLVDMMHGSIEVESKLGKGTKYTLIMEHKIVDKEYYGFNTQSTDLTDVEALKDKHILIAEDNDLNAEIAITILENMGLKVERVKDGIQCVDKIEKMPANTYDLILMDIQMPHMDGYKATETIRNLQDKEKANIPIIAMTANAFKEDKAEALNKGMNAHIAKPIDVNKIKEVLISILKQQN